MNIGGQEIGAGEGNRTLVVSLENFCSTIELHPQTPLEARASPLHRACEKVNLSQRLDDRREIEAPIAAVCELRIEPLGQIAHRHLGPGTLRCRDGQLQILEH